MDALWSTVLTVRLAHGADAEALARLAVACPMEGLLRLASVPGPRATVWEQFAGPRHTWIAEEANAVVGSVSLVERYTRLDGSLTRVGYLGELRVLPAARRRGVALALTRQGVAAERDTQSHFTALVTLGGNRAMEAFIEHSRDLPRVVPLARIRLIQWLTLVSPTPRPEMATRPARASDLSDMHRVLARSWDERVLGPALDLDHFAAEWGRDASLSLADAVVAVRNGAIVGCGALWDQRALRREIVMRYRFPLSAVARGLRLHAAWRGGPVLPPTGQPLPIAVVRFFGATDITVAVAVRDALLNMARQRGLLIVMLGLDARDPLATVARGYLHVTIPATLWIGQASHRTPDVSPLLGRPAYVDFSLV